MVAHQSVPSVCPLSLRFPSPSLILLLYQIGKDAYMVRALFILPSSFLSSPYPGYTYHSLYYGRSFFLYDETEPGKVCVRKKNSLPESFVGGDNGLIDEIAPVCPICQQFFYWFLTHHSEVLCDSTLIRLVS